MVNVNLENQGYSMRRYACMIDENRQLVGIWVLHLPSEAPAYRRKLPLPRLALIGDVDFHVL